MELTFTNGIAYFMTRQNIITKWHRHHALEFVFAWDSPFDLHTNEGQWQDIYGAVINPNYPHRFIGKEGRYLFIFLEPELLQTQQITKHFSLPEKKAFSLLPLASAPRPVEVVDFSFFEKQLAVPVSQTYEGSRDERIERTLTTIKNNLEFGPLEARVLADQVFLSESRFLHLFKEQIGIPLRKFILWCRLQRAVKELLKGRNLTASAHAAGFSDSAHFSRTFSEMFGVTPSSILKNS